MADLELNSIGNGDGNNYLLRDNTKIPLTGTNALAGSLIPSTDNSIDIGSSTNNIKMLYTKGIIIDGTQFLPSDYIPRSGGAVLTGNMLGRTVNNDELQINGGTAWGQGASIALGGKDKTGNTGIIYLHADDSTSYNQLEVLPNGEFKQNLNGTIKNVAMQEDVVPRSGGPVMTGSELGRTVNNNILRICGGTSPGDGGYVQVNGANNEVSGIIRMVPLGLNVVYKEMLLYPSGTWTWTGQAVQYISDQRLKQQISNIDDKLLDAWEDVELSQFKYNDAVEEKGNTARLHTGYVVQQIDEACKSHNVDISKYGLYCHEEYAEETREVEQADGTKKTEIVRPANEHYSLRYTETLVVECAYLRRENNRLKERLSKIEKLLNI